ncbi:hypothetical protein [Blastococcus atacamensis]|uniref:hypothetical protein n=1 Tax=Blastococcus atacamensis TaxID=2070508 RepID=UPI001E4A8A1D|nr:hypothetical protein [Blastococcus atacamensis]
MNPVADAIDGATGDWSMSGDAMRWSPELAERAPASGELGELEAGSGVGPALGLEVSGMRRLVTEALTSLGTVATDVVTDLRALSRGSSSSDDDQPPN